jgi:Tfp pilus assembly protein PilN
MPSVTQAASAVGSLALMVFVGLFWWWNDLDTQAKAQHDVWLKASDEVEAVRRSAREVKDANRDLDSELAELEAEAETRQGGLSGTDGRMIALESAISGLRDRSDVHRHVLTWLSYVMPPLDPDRSPAQLEALGGGLDGTRILLTGLEQKRDVLLLKGAAATDADVEHLLSRLRACGYLADVSLTESVQKTDTRANKPWVSFVANAELRAPPMAVALEEDP